VTVAILYLLSLLALPLGFFLIGTSHLFDLVQQLTALVF